MELKDGATLFEPAEFHEVENVGETAIRALAIEIKEPARVPKSPKKFSK